MSDKRYVEIVKHYESCLEKYGDSHLGVDWPKVEDVDTRFKVMLDIVKPHHSDKISLLDFGCGTSQLYEYILKHQIKHITYSGLDISDKFISLSRQKFPAIDYYCADILDASIQLPDFEYIIMNGVFTEKRGLSFNEMFSYFQDVILRLFPKLRIGVAFNVMSKHVDWERDDLFHLPLDLLAAFLTKRVSRNFVIRNDYGLFEYTTYVFK
jgi:SAM-dependent methyltransferase